ncbi:S41 family peptidase [Edaphobacter sp.]|uniref:S41 family peptidase n=1 Tax=Edaphobacter sp. TaxID=1934404 RepID=UPI002DB6F7B1|nr:S41 family peptidase [Edaphobacter sp.]HEU5340582.1 S41 family peptidase [Edaphobacter sp.]
MHPRTRRALFSAAVFLATCALLGSFINRNVAAQSASDESTLRDDLHDFTNVYSIVEQNYAEKMTGDKVDKAVYDGAIPGMLHVLDPHSNFYDPKAFAQMREDQHGKYYGVGMSIQPQPDPTAKNGLKIVVLAPFEGTPSYRAGIRPGDVIVAIDGKSTAGMDSVAVASSLKGPKGSHVSVTMLREGSPKPLVFDLTRDEIPRPSVDLAFMIRPGIGYIHITGFMETTSREVGDALDKFGDIHGLVLDLRGNPGGLLNEAVNTADKFLQKGQIVVSQRGRAFPDQVYRVSHGEEGAHFPIVVLVNRNTASAAEIVSGALQDHDRALIVGETTFGKGLVQTVFQTSDNTGLALTTYHYYTPSGRLIQRNYDHVSLYDYYYVRDDVPKNNADREVRLTDSGRTVYGGGGITPDEKIADIKATPFQDNLLQHYIFFNFTRHYLANRSIARDFTVDDAVMQQFKDFLKAQQIDYTDADIKDNLEWIKTSIKAELFTSQFGQLEGLKVRAEWDPQIAKALTFLPEAQALADRSMKVDQKTTASVVQ